MTVTLTVMAAAAVVVGLIVLGMALRSVERHGARAAREIQAGAIQGPAPRVEAETPIDRPSPPGPRAA